MPKIKFYKKIVIENDYGKFYIKTAHATRKNLLVALSEKPMTRNQLMKKMGWTRGQIAGLTYRAQKDGLIELKNKKFRIKRG